MPEEVRPKMLNSLNEYRWLRNYCEAYNQILATRAGYSRPLVEKLRTQNPKYFEEGTLKLKDQYVNKIDDIIWENRDVLELGDGRRDFKRRDFNRLSRYSRELSGNNVPIAPREIAPLREQYRVASEKRENDSREDYKNKVQEHKKAVKQRRKATRGVVGRSVLFGLGLVGGLGVLGAFGAAVWTTVSGVLATSFGIATGAGMVGVIGGVLAGKWLIGKFASIMKTLRENLSTAIKQRKEAKRSVKEKKKERNAARSIYHKNALANAIDRTSEASYPYERAQTLNNGLGNVHQKENGQKLTDNDVLTAVANLGLGNENAAPVNAAGQETGAPVNESGNFVNPSGLNQELGDNSTGNEPEPVSTYTSNETEPEYFNENGDRFYPGPFELHSENGRTTEPRPEPASTYTRSPFGFPPAGGSGDDTASGDTATSDRDRDASAGSPRPTSGFVPPITPAPRPRRDEFEEERTFTYEPNRVDEHNFEEDIRSGGGSGNDAGNGTGAVTGGGSFQRNNRGNQPNIAPKTSKGLVTINDLTKYLKGGELSPEKGSALSQYLGLGSSYSPAELKQDFEDNFTTNNIKNHTTTIKKAFNDAVKEAKEHSGSGYENSGIDLGATMLIDTIRKEANKEPLAQTYAKSEPTEPKTPDAPEIIAANEPGQDLLSILVDCGYDRYRKQAQSLASNAKQGLKLGTLSKDLIDGYKKLGEDLGQIRDALIQKLERYVEVYNNRVENPITLKMLLAVEEEINRDADETLNAIKALESVPAMDEPTEPEAPEMPDAVANDPELELTDIVRATGFEDYLLSIKDNYNPNKDDINEIKREVEEQKDKFFTTVENKVEEFNNNESNLNPITMQMVASLENEANEYVEDILNSMQNASANEITEPEIPAIDPVTALNNEIREQRERLHYDTKLEAIARNRSLDKQTKIDQMRSLENDLIARISEFYDHFNGTRKSKITEQMYQDAIDTLDTEVFEMLNSEGLEEIKPKKPEPKAPAIDPEQSDNGDWVLSGYKPYIGSDNAKPNLEPKSQEPEEPKPEENKKPEQPKSEVIEPEIKKKSLLSPSSEQVRNYLIKSTNELVSEGKEVNKDNILARAYDLAHRTEDETGKGFEPAIFADDFGKEIFYSKYDQEEADVYFNEIINEVTKEAKAPEKPEPEPEKPKDNPVPKTSENKNNNKGKGKPGKNSGKGSEGPQPGEE